MRSSPGRLGWYARRLRSMSMGEIAWRGQRLVSRGVPHPDISSLSAARLLRADSNWSLAAERFRSAEGRPILLDRVRAHALAERHPDQVQALVAAAERVRAGHVQYFGYPEVQLTTPIDWNHDPIAGFHWPSRDSSRIDHRVAAADPKWIWELNRLQHLPWLAEAWLFTGDDGFAEVALDHLDSWIDQNPVGRGIAWRGAFEAGVRAVSVATALQGLRDSPALTPTRFERSIRMLAASADLCWRHRSRFSSANNHLVGELAGLATVAAMFPELAGAERWAERALRGLTVEANRQILPDGSGAEQAVGYQVFTAELMLVVGALLTSRGGTAPTDVCAAVDRSADYLAAVVGLDDPDPRYGDDDEGFALRLGPERRRTVRDHLGVVSAWTGHVYADQAGSVTLTALWVEAMTESSNAEQVPERGVRPGSLVAPDGGLVVLRSGGRRLTMDVAPLGYLSIAAHGHADALAITLSLDGREVIGDPGAASYYGHPEWRLVHRGTRVHATVTVDGENQSVSGGPFMWIEHAQVRVRAVELDIGVVDAEHDGYHRLPQPVTHRRWVSAHPDGGTMLVVDEISGSGEHEMRVSWPLHPSLDIRQVDRGYVVVREGEDVAEIAFAATAATTVDHVRGDDVQHLGWWSDQLEAREPSWLLGAVVHGRVPLVMATLVQPVGQGGPAIVDPVVSQAGDTITATWGYQGDRRSAVIDRSRAGAVELLTWPTS